MVNQNINQSIFAITTTLFLQLTSSVLLDLIIGTYISLDQSGTRYDPYGESITAIKIATNFKKNELDHELLAVLYGISTIDARMIRHIRRRFNDVAKSASTHLLPLVQYLHLQNGNKHFNLLPPQSNLPTHFDLSYLCYYHLYMTVHTAPISYRYLTRSLAQGIVSYLHQFGQIDFLKLIIPQTISPPPCTQVKKPYITSKQILNAVFGDKTEKVSVWEQNFGFIRALLTSEPIPMPIINTPTTSFELLCTLSGTKYTKDPNPPRVQKRLQMQTQQRKQKCSNARVTRQSSSQSLLPKELDSKLENTIVQNFFSAKYLVPDHNITQLETLQTVHLQGLNSRKISHYNLKPGHLIANKAILEPYLSSHPLSMGYNMVQFTHFDNEEPPINLAEMIKTKYKPKFELIYKVQDRINQIGDFNASIAGLCLRNNPQPKFNENNQDKKAAVKERRVILCNIPFLIAIGQYSTHRSSVEQVIGLTSRSKKNQQRSHLLPSSRLGMHFESLFALYESPTMNNKRRSCHNAYDQSSNNDELLKAVQNCRCRDFGCATNPFGNKSMYVLNANTDTSPLTVQTFPLLQLNSLNLSFFIPNIPPAIYLSITMMGLFKYIKDLAQRCAGKVLMFERSRKIATLTSTLQILSNQQCRMDGDCQGLTWLDIGPQPMIDIVTILKSINNSSIGTAINETLGIGSPLNGKSNWNVLRPVYITQMHQHIITILQSDFK
jgi:hypothetical protein